MSYLLHLVAITFLALTISGCSLLKESKTAEKPHTSQPTQDKEKHATKQPQPEQLLLHLAEAKLALDTKSLSKGIHHLKRAGQLGSGRINDGAMPSDLMAAELSYVAHGSKTVLYLPAGEGASRFTDTQGMLKQAASADIEPDSYRLITLTPKKGFTAKALSLLREALKEADAPADANSVHPSIRVQRILDRYYALLDAKTYEGKASKRMAYHSQAAHSFLNSGQYDLARIALDEAEDAMEDEQLNHPGQQTSAMVHFSGYLESLDKAISRKKPSMADIFKGKVDTFFDTILTD